MAMTRLPSSINLRRSRYHETEEGKKEKIRKRQKKSSKQRRSYIWGSSSLRESRSLRPLVMSLMSCLWCVRVFRASWFVAKGLLLHICWISCVSIRDHISVRSYSSSHSNIIRANKKGEKYRGEKLHQSLSSS